MAPSTTSAAGRAIRIAARQRGRCIGWWADATDGPMQATAPDTADPWAGCNPLEPAFRDDPYPSLHRLRAREPVTLTPLGIWRLTRHADVVRLLHDVPAGVRTTDGRLTGTDESVHGPRN